MAPALNERQPFSVGLAGLAWRLALLSLAGCGGLADDRRAGEPSPTSGIEDFVERPCVGP